MYTASVFGLRQPAFGPSPTDTVSKSANALFENNRDKDTRDTIVSNEIDLIVDDTLTGIRDVKTQDKAIIGGNFCRWYGGFDSYIIAQEFGVPLYAPSMGRKIDGEEQIPDLTHLPFMPWKDWMFKLAEFKYGIHLMQMPNNFATLFAIPRVRGKSGPHPQRDCPD